MSFTWQIQAGGVKPRRAGQSIKLIDGAYRVKVTDVERVAKKNKPDESNTVFTVQLTEPGFEGAKRTIRIPDPSPTMKDGGDFSRQRSVNALMSLGLLDEQTLATLPEDTPINVGLQDLVGKEGFVSKWDRPDNRPGHEGEVHDELDFCQRDEYEADKASAKVANGAQTGTAAAPGIAATAGQPAAAAIPTNGATTPAAGGGVSLGSLLNK